MIKRTKGLRIISYWLVLSSLPGILAYLEYGVDQGMWPVAIAEWIYYACAFACAMGLYRAKEWARKLAVILFVVYFVWTLYVTFYISGASFNLLIEGQSSSLLVAPGLLKNIVVTLLVTYILWPIVAMLFLTYPRVKSVFDPNFDPEIEKEELKKR